MIIFMQDNPVSVRSTGIKGSPLIRVLRQNTKGLKGKNSPKIVRRPKIYKKKYTSTYKTYHLIKKKVFSLT